MRDAALALDITWNEHLFLILRAANPPWYGIDGRQRRFAMVDMRPTGDSCGCAEIGMDVMGAVIALCALGEHNIAAFLRQNFTSRCFTLCVETRESAQGMSNQSIYPRRRGDARRPRVGGTGALACGVRKRSESRQCGW